MATRSLNKVTLIGNLTRDPEIRYTSSGSAMCTFGLATNRSWKDGEGNLQEEAEFHNLVAWNKMAEVCYQLLAKGMKVYIEGELRTRDWQTDEGEKRYRTEIKTNEMILLNNKGKSGVGGAAEGSSSDDISVEEVEAKSDKDDQKKEAPKKKEEAPKVDETADEDLLDDNLPF